MADGGPFLRPDPNLTPRQRRALIRRAFLRPLITAGLLLGMYAVVPLSEFDDRRNLVLLISVLVAFGFVVWWQVNRIVKSDRPVLQAAEGLSAALPMYLLGFSAIYYVMSMEDPELFSETMSRTAALYFTVTVFGTVGFGDITPTTDLSRAIVTGQMVLNLLILGLGGRVLYGAVQHGLQRRDKARLEAEAAEPPDSA